MAAPALAECGDRVPLRDMRAGVVVAAGASAQGALVIGRPNQGPKVNGQRSAVNGQLSTVNCPTVNGRSQRASGRCQRRRQLAALVVVLVVAASVAVQRHAHRVPHDTVEPLVGERARVPQHAAVGVRGARALALHRAQRPHDRACWPRCDDHGSR